MRKTFLLPIAFIFVAGTPVAAATQNDDFLIVSGERVGAITKDASEDSLRAIYGNDRVEPVLVNLSEGFVCKGSRILFDNGESLEITWLDVEAKAAPIDVYIRGESWRTDDGVGLGISLRELEEINGKPFRLRGFYWDFAGTVISWAGGRLEGRTHKMWLALMPDEEAYLQLPVEEGRQVAGDIELSSDHPVLQKLNPRLDILVVPLVLNERCKEFFNE